MNTFRFEKEDSIGKIILTDNPAEKKGLSFEDTLRNAVLAANGTDIRVLVLTSESGNFTVTKDPGELIVQGHSASGSIALGLANRQLPSANG